MKIDKTVRMRGSRVIPGTNRREREKTYHLEILRFPTLRSYLRSELYHWYDMRIPCKIPGWLRLNRWLRDHGAEHRHGFPDEPKARWRDRLYGWSVEQDFRCYHYGTYVPELVVVVPITEQQYWDLRKRPVGAWEQKDYDEFCLRSETDITPPS